MGGARLRLGIDATSLLGVRTGIGQVTAGLVAGLAERPELDVATGPRSPGGAGPRWLGAARLRSGHDAAGSGSSDEGVLAAGALAEDRDVDRPRRRGAHDELRGAARGPVLVTVADLSYLLYRELCSDDVLRFPRLVQVAIDRGATVHVYSAFVGGQVQSERYGLAEDRVVEVAPGLGPPRRGDPESGRRLTDRVSLRAGVGDRRAAQEPPGPGAGLRPGGGG